MKWRRCQEDELTIKKYRCRRADSTTISRAPRCDASQRERVRGNAVGRDAFGAQRSHCLANELEDQRRAGADRVGWLDALLGNQYFKHARPRRASSRACAHNQCLEQDGAIARSCHFVKTCIEWTRKTYRPVDAAVSDDEDVDEEVEANEDGEGSVANDEEAVLAKIEDEDEDEAAAALAETAALSTVPPSSPSSPVVASHERLEMKLETNKS